MSQWAHFIIENNFKMKEKPDTIITIPFNKALGEITKETELKAKYEEYTTNRELGAEGVHLICKRGRETHRIYIRKNQNKQ